MGMPGRTVRVKPKIPSTAMSLRAMREHANAFGEADAIPPGGRFGFWLLVWRSRKSGWLATRFRGDLGDFEDRGLTEARVSGYRQRMAQSFLVFDFGTDEELAQQARHKVDGWKQGFRLDKKLLLKFDRAEAAETAETPDTENTEEEPTSQKGAKKSGKAAKGAKAANAKDKEAKEKIQLIIRLDFSDHERLSHQRWLDRIPTEAPFKDLESKIIRHNDAEFAGTAERFESLP